MTYLEKAEELQEKIRHGINHSDEIFVYKKIKSLET